MKNELSVAQRLDVLASCQVLKGAPRSDLRLLAEMALRARARKGEDLFEAGDPADGVYVVATGLLGVIPPGHADMVRELGPGELLGEYGLALDSRRTATARALDDTDLLFIDYRRFRAFLVQRPESLFVLFQTAVLRLSELEEKNKATF